MVLSARELPIVRPCPVDLPDDFRGEAGGGPRTRHCGHCNKTVHLLSSLTARQADALLAEQAGRDVCVTYLVDASGEIRFAPEPPPAPIVPVSSLVRRRGAAIATAGLAIALAACAPHENPEVRRSGDDIVDVRDDRPTIPSEPCETDEPPLVMAAGGIGPAPIERVDPKLEPPVHLEAGGIRRVEKAESEPPPVRPKMLAGKPRLR